MARWACAAILLSACGASCPPAVAAPAGPPPRQRAPSPDPPPGSIVMRPLGIQPAPEGFVLLLADASEEHTIPILIGGTEAMTIELRMNGEHFQRPLTHDLLDTVIERLGGQVVYVHVDKLRDGAFVGSVYLWDGHRMHRIDARTSDAVAIALGHDAPIFVAQSVVEEAGEDLETHD